MEEARRLGLTLKEYVLGYDGIAVLVHPSNPVRELTLEQVADLFAGRIDDWRQVGGADLPVRRISRPAYSGTHGFFRDTVLGGAPFAPGTEWVEHSEEIVRLVASNPAAISYLGMGWQGPGVKAVAVAPAAGKAAVLPSGTSVRAGSYPIYRPLLLYTRGEPRGELRRLLAFVLGPGGQDLVEEHQFIRSDAPCPVCDEAVPASPREGRDIELHRVYFSFGGSRLDAEARRVLAAAQRLLAGGRRALITGHADADGTPEQNAAVARAVARALVDLGVPVDLLAVEGRGSEEPIATNETPSGRNRNRRADLRLLPRDRCSDREARSCRGVVDSAPNRPRTQARRLPGTFPVREACARPPGQRGEPLSETVILVNPRAGSGRAMEVWERARLGGAVPEEARVVLAGDPRAAAEQLDEALAGNPPVRRLVAVGGDGTVHLAANRLVADGLADQVALGMLPAGTGSDLARTLGLPRDPAAALRHACTAGPRSVDLVEVECEGPRGRRRRVVLNVASAGISGPVAQRINAMPVKRATVYLTGALAAVATFRPYRGRVTVDGEPFHEGGVYLLAVANGPSFGKGMRVAPEARVDDGLADVVVVRAMPRWRVPLCLPRLYLGNLLSSSAVAWRRGREVRLESAELLPPLEVDGETVETAKGTPVTFRLLPGALKFAA